MPKLTQNSKYNITNHNAKIFFLAKTPGKFWNITVHLFYTKLCSIVGILLLNDVIGSIDVGQTSLK